MLSAEERREIDHEIAIVPVRSAACIEALKVVQRHRGWVSDDAIEDIARYLEMSAAELDSVATFYNLIFRKKVGRHIIRFCDSVSCWVMENRALGDALTAKLGIRFGETTADGRFTLTSIQCLGTCDHAPAVMVDDDLHRDLTPASLLELLEKYR